MEIEIEESHLDRGNRANIEHLDDPIVLEKLRVLVTGVRCYIDGPSG